MDTSSLLRTFSYLLLCWISIVDVVSCENWKCQREQVECVCLRDRLIGEIVMLDLTKRIYFVRCVRNHYEFEWFLLSCKLLIEWLWTKVHCTWRLLEDIMITWPTNWRRYRKHSFRLSSLVFRCCCKNRSDDGWKWQAKLHYLNWYIILPRNSNTGIK